MQDTRRGRLLQQLVGSLFRQCASDRERRSDRVSNRSNVREAQTDERLSLTRCEDKLDFKTIGRVKIHDSAEVTTTQAMLGKVPIQNDGVEQVEHGYPGWAG